MRGPLGALASTTPMATTTLQVMNLIGATRKSKRAVRAAHTLNNRAVHSVRHALHTVVVYVRRALQNICSFARDNFKGTRSCLVEAYLINIVLFQQDWIIVE